jgi:hypothetical protein
MEKVFGAFNPTIGGSGGTKFAALGSLEYAESGSWSDKFTIMYSGNSIIYTFAFKAIVKCKAWSASIGDSKQREDTIGH